MIVQLRRDCHGTCQTFLLSSRGLYTRRDQKQDYSGDIGDLSCHRCSHTLACAGAIGSAEWSGVKLRDVLRFAGFDEDNSDGVAHVQFEGLDSDTSGTCYGSSIPIDKAMGSHGDVLLAFSMNGRYSCCTALSVYCFVGCVSVCTCVGLFMFVCVLVWRNMSPSPF